MLWRVLQSNAGLPNDAVVCFANTGKEDEETLKFVNEVSRNWGIDIAWLEYRNDELGYAFVDFKSASRNGEPFDALIKKKHYLPNAVTRFCSHELKNKPITKFTGLEEEDTMIGVRADEVERIPKMRSRGFIIPLADSCVTKRTVQQFWMLQNFDLGLKSDQRTTPLGNCDLCFLKGFHVIHSIVSSQPDRAIWWASKEKEIGATFHKDRPTYEQMRQNALNQTDFIGYEEESIPCFCGD
jgi:3'-phosphoadenosine 5'-phosphosulfate sulfotransferase (PAPS reductase)/FAD synthetase